jgi:hypothetical protein
VIARKNLLMPGAAKLIWDLSFKDASSHRPNSLLVEKALISQSASYVLAQ